MTEMIVLRVSLSNINGHDFFILPKINVHEVFVTRVKLKIKEEDIYDGDYDVRSFTGSYLHKSTPGSECVRFNFSLSRHITITRSKRNVVIGSVGLLLNRSRK